MFKFVWRDLKDRRSEKHRHGPRTKKSDKNQLYQSQTPIKHRNERQKRVKSVKNYHSSRTTPHSTLSIASMKAMKIQFTTDNTKFTIQIIP